jgi:hypothetical protein
MLNVITFSVTGARLDVAAGAADGLAGDPFPPHAVARIKQAIAAVEVVVCTVFPAAN